MMDLLLLLLLVAFLFLWFDSLRALEVARNEGKRACNNANVQFLDDMVSGIALALVRDEFGYLAVRRTYRFEFSETGNSRREGILILLGAKLESVKMEPYQLLL